MNQGNLIEQKSENFPNLEGLEEYLIKNWMEIQPLGNDFFRISGFVFQFTNWNGNLVINLKLDDPSYLARSVEFAQDVANFLNPNSSERMQSVYVEFEDSDANLIYEYEHELKVKAGIKYKIPSDKEISTVLPLDCISELDRVLYLDENVTRPLNRNRREESELITLTQLNLSLKLKTWLDSKGANVKRLIYDTEDNLDSLDDSFFQTNIDELIEFYILITVVFNAMGIGTSISKIRKFFEGSRLYDLNKTRLALLNKVIIGTIQNDINSLDILEDFALEDIIRIRKVNKGFSENISEIEGKNEKINLILQNEVKGAEAHLKELPYLLRLYKLYYILVSKFNIAGELIRRLGWGDELSNEDQLIISKINLAKSPTLRSFHGTFGEIMEGAARKTLVGKLSNRQYSTKDNNDLLDNRLDMSNLNITVVDDFDKALATYRPREFWTRIVEMEFIRYRQGDNYSSLITHIFRLNRTNGISNTLKNNLFTELENFLQDTLDRLSKENVIRDEYGTLGQLYLTLAIIRPNGAELLQRYLNLPHASMENLLDDLCSKMSTIISDVASITSSDANFRSTLSDKNYRNIIENSARLIAEHDEKLNTEFFTPLPHFQDDTAEILLRMLSIVIFLNKFEHLKNRLPKILGLTLYGTNDELIVFLVESGLAMHPDYRNILVLLKDNLKRYVQADILRERDRSRPLDANVTQEESDSITTDEIIQQVQKSQAILKNKIFLDPNFWNMTSDFTESNVSRVEMRPLYADNGNLNYWGELERALNYVKSSQMNIRREYGTNLKTARMSIGGVVERSKYNLHSQNGDVGEGIRPYLDQRSAAREKNRSEITAYKNLINGYSYLHKEIVDCYSRSYSPINNEAMVSDITSLISGYFQEYFVSKERFRDPSVKFQINIEAIGIEFAEELISWLRPLTNPSMHSAFLQSIKNDPKSFLSLLKSTFFNAITKSSISQQNTRFVEFLMLENGQDVESLYRLGEELTKIFAQNTNEAVILVEAIRNSHAQDYAPMREHLHSLMSEKTKQTTKAVYFEFDDGYKAEILVPEYLEGDAIYVYINYLYESLKREHTFDQKIIQFVRDYLESKGIKIDRYSDDKEILFSIIEPESNPRIEQIAKQEWRVVGEIKYIANSQGSNFLMPNGFYDLTGGKFKKGSKDPKIKLVNRFDLDSLNLDTSSDLVYQHISKGTISYGSSLIIRASSLENHIAQIVISNPYKHDRDREVNYNITNGIQIKLDPHDTVYIHEKPRPTADLFGDGTVVQLNDIDLELTGLPKSESFDFGDTELNLLWSSLRQAILENSESEIERLTYLCLVQLRKLIFTGREYGFGIVKSIGERVSVNEGKLILQKLIETPDLSASCQETQIAAAYFFSTLGIRSTVVQGLGAQRTRKGNVDYLSAKENIGHLTTLIGSKFIIDFTPRVVKQREIADAIYGGLENGYSFVDSDRVRDVEVYLDGKLIIQSGEQSENRSRQQSNITSSYSPEIPESECEVVRSIPQHFIQNIRDNLFLIVHYFNININNQNLIDILVDALLTFLSLGGDESFQDVINIFNSVYSKVISSPEYFINNLGGSGTTLSTNSIISILSGIYDGGEELNVVLNLLGGNELRARVEGLNGYSIRLVALFKYINVLAESIKYYQHNDLFNHALKDRFNKDFVLNHEYEEAGKVIKAAIKNGLRYNSAYQAVAYKFIQSLIEATNKNAAN